MEKRERKTLAEIINLNAEYNASLHTVQKNNHSIEALCIKRQNEDIGIVIYDDVVESLRAGTSDDIELVKKLLEFANEHLTDTRADGLMPKNKEEVLENIQLCLANRNWNPELEKEVLWKKVDDTDLMTYPIFVKKKEGEPIASIKVTPGFIAWFKLNEEELWERAKANTDELCTSQTMSEVLCELLGTTPPTLPYEIYIVSNKDKYKGAGAMLNKDVLNALKTRLQTDSLVVLPSSIHEVLVVPNVSGAEAFATMIREVNASQVSPEERLSDHAYEFDGTTFKNL